MIEMLKKLGWISMAESSVLLPKVVSYGGSQIDFYYLQGFRQQVPQSEIEMVGSNDILEGRSSVKRVPPGFEGKAVAAKAIVVEM
jgi:hypothetical protein